jgi:hypothetical protein
MFEKQQWFANNLEMAEMAKVFAQSAYLCLPIWTSSLKFFGCSASSASSATVTTLRSQVHRPGQPEAATWDGQEAYLPGPSCDHSNRMRWQVYSMRNTNVHCKKHANGYVRIMDLVMFDAFLGVDGCSVTKRVTTIWVSNHT